MSRFRKTIDSLHVCVVIISRPMGTKDYNGDGRADILWRHTSGAVATWLMNGTTATSGGAFGPIESAWQIANPR